jgi:hypothetical protein
MSEFFEIGEIETRIFGTTAQRMEIQMVRAAIDHVGDPFVLRREKLYRGCGRCGGYGEYSYNRIDGSRCFDCAGHGLGKETTWADAEKLVKTRRAARDRKNRNERNAAHEAALAFDAMWDEAADVIGWLAGKEERNGFIGDIARKVANLVVLSEKQIAAIRKIIAQDAEKKESAAKAGHFGEIAKRVEVEVQVAGIRVVESAFGESLLITMRTREGHVLKSFASSAWAYAAEVSPAFVKVKLTPKKHEEYNGEPQTMVSRVAAA